MPLHQPLGLHRAQPRHQHRLAFGQEAGDDLFQRFGRLAFPIDHLGKTAAGRPLQVHVGVWQRHRGRSGDLADKRIHRKPAVQQAGRQSLDLFCIHRVQPAGFGDREDWQSTARVPPAPRDLGILTRGPPVRHAGG